MFRQVIAIIRGRGFLRSYSYSLYCGCIWITARPEWSVVKGCNQSCTHVEECNQSCAHVEGCNQSCTHVEGCNQSCTHVEGCNQSCTHVEGCNQSCTRLVTSLDNWPLWTGRNPYTPTIQTAWVASEVTTTPWWWHWVAETCWGKSRNVLIKILLLPRRICWLFYNNATKMLGPPVKK
jgi:hypothetical protein